MGHVDGGFDDDGFARDFALLLCAEELCPRHHVDRDQGVAAMSAILRFFVLLIVVVGVGQASASPALAVPTLPPNSAFRELSLEPGTLHVGESRELHVQFKHAASQLTILTLDITYPSGLTQNVVHSTLGNEATLTWTVPPRAGTGQATYRLETSSCGCGDHDSPQADASVDVAEGSFTVE